jgi:hypothetical protein
MVNSASMCHLFAWNPLTFVLTPFTLKPDKPCLTSKSFTVASLRYGMATSQSGAPQGRSVQSSRPRFPKKNKSLHKTKYLRNAAQARVEPPRAKRSLHKAKKPSMNKTLLSIAKDKILNNA